MTRDQWNKILKKEGSYFEFFKYNLKCYGKRNHLNAWCGYIEIPSVHKFYKDYREDYDIIHTLFVHGGITWDKLNSDGKKLTIGFDCAHAGDLVSYNNFLYEEININMGGTYRDKEYVTEQIESLATQIHNYFPEFFDLTVKALKNINRD